jgi:Flp pilus assembly protein TadB
MQASRRPILYFCLALFLLAAFIPGVLIPPVILIQVGFVFAALISAPIANICPRRKPQLLEALPILSPRPPPAA